MSRACTVCTHPRRPELERELTAGASNRSVGGRYGLTESAIRRHVSSGHMDASVSPLILPFTVADGGNGHPTTGDRVDVPQTRPLDARRLWQELSDALARLKIYEAELATAHDYGKAVGALDRQREQLKTMIDIAAKCRELEREEAAKREDKIPNIMQWVKQRGLQNDLRDYLLSC